MAISILLRPEPSSFETLEPRWVQKETLKTGTRKVFTQLGYGVLFLQSSLELPSKSDAKYAQKGSQHLPSFPRSRLSGCHATPTSFPGSTLLSRWRLREDPGTTVMIPALIGLKI